MINCFRSLKYRLSRKALTILYTSFILPVFDYGDVIWDNCSDCHATALENLHLEVYILYAVLFGVQVTI